MAKAEKEAPKTEETDAKKPEQKPAEPPPKPADPRLKVLKKFHGKFLPKGPLRERHATLLTRWNSGDDHGGVTVEELKTLLDDWKKTKAKPVKN